MSENDWDGWKLLTDKLGKRCQLVGDDVFVTNVEFLKKGIDMGCANSILIKVTRSAALLKPLMPLKWPTGQAIQQLPHTAQVKQKMLPLPILQ